MLGHHHESQNTEIVTIAHFVQYLQKTIVDLLRFRQGIRRYNCMWLNAGRHDRAAVPVFLLAYGSKRALFKPKECRTLFECW